MKPPMPNMVITEKINHPICGMKRVPNNRGTEIAGKKIFSKGVIGMRHSERRKTAETVAPGRMHKKTRITTNGAKNTPNNECANSKVETIPKIRKNKPQIMDKIGRCRICDAPEIILSINISDTSMMNNQTPTKSSKSNCGNISSMSNKVKTCLINSGHFTSLPCDETNAEIEASCLITLMKLSSCGDCNGSTLVCEPFCMTRLCGVILPPTKRPGIQEPVPGSKPKDSRVETVVKVQLPI